MAQDAQSICRSTDGSSASNAARRAAAQFLLTALCAAGLLAIGMALVSPDLEWRMLSMAALTFAASPLIAQLRISDDGVSTQAPLAHPMLFASSLALGPVGAALPGAFSGIARLLSDHSRTRPLVQICYTILKPAVVCASAALAYVGAGGNVLAPQEVSSIVPLVWAAVVYVGVNTLLVGVADGLQGSKSPRASRTPGVVAAWLLCFLAGHALAVLYALAPAYVLLGPAVAVGLVRLALRAATGSPDRGKRKETGAAPKRTASARRHGEFVDPATGLANQRYLALFLNGEVSRAQRSGKPLSVAIFDVDGFEDLTARAGREAAAGVITDIAGCLKAGLRDYDLVASSSPGRLLAVLPETSAETAFEVSKRLHQSMTSLRVSEEPLSVTVGISTFPEHGSTPDELVNSSHHALNRGRFQAPNQVYSCHKLAKAS